MLTAKNKEAKRIEIMEKSFECYCENGLRDTGIKALAAACGMSAPNFYSYFDNLDQLIAEATTHCMEKIELEFMSRAPKSKDEIFTFIENEFNPNGKFYSKEYRFAQQVFMSPKYLPYGKKYLHDKYERMRKYAEELAEPLGVSWWLILQWLLVFEQAIVDYAIYEYATAFMLKKILLTNMAESMLIRDIESSYDPELDSKLWAGEIVDVPINHHK